MGRRDDVDAAQSRAAGVSSMAARAEVIEMTRRELPSTAPMSARYSSMTVLVAQRASGFNLEIELKNIILRRVSIFEFLHSQGHLRRFGNVPTTSALPL